MDFPNADKYRHQQNQNRVNEEFQDYANINDSDENKGLLVWGGMGLVAGGILYYFISEYL